MLQRLVVLSAFFGLLAQAAPAVEQESALHNQIVLVASPPRFDEQKQVYEIDRSDVFVTATFGGNDKAVTNKAVLLTLEATQASGPATSYVYGAQCTTSDCPDASKRYDNSGTNKGAISAGTLKGSWYQDAITIGQKAKLPNVVFASLSQGLSTEQYDGQVSLGIGTNQLVDQLFALGKDPYITIYTGKQNDGQLVIGRNGHDKCNGAVFWKITGDAWDVQETTIDVDGNKADKRRLSFSTTEKQLIIPTEQYNAVVKDAKLNGQTVDDISKLKQIKITIGNTDYTIKPEDFTDKGNDNKYTLLLSASTNNNPAIVLGTPFLTSRCLVLDGKDSKAENWQVGVGEAKGNGAGVFGLSALLFAFVSVFHFLRL